MLTAAGFNLPAWLLRGKANVTQCPVYQDGSLSAPTAATYLLVDEDGATVITGAATVTAGVATYTIPAGSLPTTLRLSWYWRETWTLTLAGAEHTFERAAHLVRRVPYPTLTAADLYDHQEICRQIALASDINFVGKIEEAWGILLRRLMLIHKQRPPRLLDYWQLRDWHLYLTLSLVFRAGGERWRQLAQDYTEMAKEQEEAQALTIDIDDSGGVNMPQEDAVKVAGGLRMRRLA
jgi:hypothetical protein